jgi:hypothetical protein
MRSRASAPALSCGRSQRIGELIDTAEKLGVMEKSGTWYSYDGAKLGQGRDKVLARPCRSLPARPSECTARSARRFAGDRPCGPAPRRRNEQPPREHDEEEDRHALGYSTRRAPVTPRRAASTCAGDAPTRRHLLALRTSVRSPDTNDRRVQRADGPGAPLRCRLAQRPDDGSVGTAPPPCRASRPTPPAPWTRRPHRGWRSSPATTRSPAPPGRRRRSHTVQAVALPHTAHAHRSRARSYVPVHRRELPQQDAAVLAVMPHCAASKPGIPPLSTTQDPR